MIHVVQKSLLALFRTVLIVLSMTCCTLPAVQGQTTPQRTLDRLRFTVAPEYGGVVVPVSINGKGPFRFLVDMGTNASAITEAALARLDAKEYRSEVENTNANTYNDQKVRRIICPNVFMLGKMEFTALSLEVVPKDLFSSASDAIKDIDGIIGSICLSIFAVEFDFKDRLLSEW